MRAVSKPSPLGVAVPAIARHAFQVDQREWDYGARMSRGRRAAEARPTRSPESPDLAESEPKWASLTDTGSLQPSEEALDWQRRADAWAQQAETENSQAVEPANRWSEVATGRPTFPADGVGWRTETAEWRATGARWRQTTEWRSTTGSHGWRSTTEAWQTGGSSSYPPQAETPMSQPAISSTAWRSDEPAGTADDDARPAWQQFTDPAPADSRHSTPSWQTPDPPQTSTPSWQQPQTSTPSWQQPQQQPEPSTPSWNQSSWLQPEQPATPSRQQPAPRPPAESSPSWQQLVDPTQQPTPPPTWTAPETPTWRGGAIEGTATWSDLTDARSRPETPSWQRSTGLPEQPAPQPRDDGRHLVREDDRAAWRRDAGDGSPPAGRRRAPETGSRTSGGTGWSTHSDADNWAGHTDTGNIQLYPDPATPEAPSWGGGRRAEPTGRRALPATPPEEPGYQIPPATPYETGRRGRPADTSGTRALPPGRPDEAPRGRRRAEDPRTDVPPTGRRAARYADDQADQGYPPRRAAAQSAAMPLDDTRTGRRRRDEAPPPVTRRAAAEAMPLDRRPDEMPPPGRRPDEMPPPPGRRGAPGAEAAPKGRARYNPGRTDWREQTGSWEAEPDTSSWTRDPDTGQWSRAEDDPRVLAWRREAARREEMTQQGEQRALPAGPASWNRDEDETSVYGEPLVDDRRDDDPPPRRGGGRGGAAAPGSATPYGGGAGAPRSGTPYGSPRGGTYGSGPDDPYGGGPGYDDGPRGGAVPRYDGPRGGTYGSAPNSAIPGGAPTYGEPTGETYGGAPTYGEPTGETYGGAPTYGEPTGTYGGEPGYSPPRRRAIGSAPSSAVPSTAPPRYNGSAPASGLPYGGAPSGPPPYGSPAGRRRAEPDGPRGTATPDVYGKPAVDPELWRREPESPESRLNRHLGMPDQAPPSWAESPDDRQRMQPGEWQRREREERARGSAVYRGESGPNDWRRDLAEQSNLAEGESRRYGTSDFIPFQSSGSAAVPRSSNLSMTSTSLISPVPREQREAEARPPRSGNGFQGLTGSYERRAVTGGFTPGRRSNLLDPDDEEDDQEEAAGPLAAVGYTVIWYGVPVVLFVLYMLVVNTGSQTHALDTLAKAAPQFAISLVLSILVAYGLRFVSHSWKAISVGLAAAVVGGGLATVLTSAITGNSLS